MSGRTLFAQTMDFLPWTTFERIVCRYRGNRRVRTLRCAEQYRAMAFAQLTYRESLRDIEACLGAQAGRLYHSGFRSPVRRSTLADANERRDWRIYADFAQRLIHRARLLHAGDRSLAPVLDETVYALDATIIDLCLSVFPWARFRSTKAAVKLHTLLDLQGAIPAFVHVSDGKFHDVNMLDLLVPEPGAIYVMDRAYGDFLRFHRLHRAGAFFVTRAKNDLDARRVYSRPRDPANGILSDHLVRLGGTRSRARYPELLRRVRFRDPETGRLLVFLTNRMDYDPLTVCKLYRSRWHIELFFKWIKQHLRIKRFFGASENAVKTQLWIAVSVYVLVAIVRKRLELDTQLYRMLQVLSVMPFEKIPIKQALGSTALRNPNLQHDNQLNLFDNLTGH